MTGPAAHDDFEPSSRHWQSQGLRLHYLDWGNDGAPTLLLLHGNRDHARSWDPVARTLRKDWHVIAPDLRGHGDSAWSPDGAYLTPYHLMDIADLTDTLGDGPLTLVGHSFGGNVSLRYTAVFPERVRKLAIVDGLGPWPATVAKWVEIGPIVRTREWIEKRRLVVRPPRPLPTIEEGAARLAKSNPRLTAEMATHLATHGLRRQEADYVWKYDPLVSVFAPEDFLMESTETWCAIDIPTLLFHGAESWTSNPVEDGRAAFFKDARTVAYKEAGHWVHHDQPEAFLDALTAFL